ncbi:VOC family protein [uncultured Sphingomonas sp.]|uniref:VOC family protein n=1 Tax=uncultured Sphingomonas sp. TaxID=158754 RepID=UPI0035CA221D
MTSLTQTTIDSPADNPDVLAARRRTNRIGKLHHHAFMARDLEETRHFYEDLLGLPLVGTWVERVNPTTNQPDNYAHAFFELSDGSCLAFFQFKDLEASLGHSVNKFTPISPFGHHIALTVEGKDTVQDFKSKLDAEGVETFLTDHGYCYSVYFYDPNGLQVELTTLVEPTTEMMRAAATNAHTVMERWRAEDEVESNNTRRGTGWMKS